MNTRTTLAIVGLFVLFIAAFIIVTQEFKWLDNRIRLISTPGSNYQIVLECQKMAATTYNKDWSYKDCIGELQKALNENSRLKAL